MLPAHDPIAWPPWRTRRVPTHFHAYLHPWKASEDKRGIPFLAQDRPSTDEEYGAAAAALAGQFTQTSRP